MTYRSTEELMAEATSDLRRFMRGMARRMTFLIVDGNKWQVRGQRGGTGGDEVIELEPFTGIGFYSVPPTDGKPEVITLSIGASKSTVIVAARDEATRRAMVPDLQPDETAIFTSTAIVILKADGTVEIRSKSGTAVSLATNAQLAMIVTALTNAITTLGVGAPSAQLAALKAQLLLLNALWPTGTTVLKGE